MSYPDEASPGIDPEEILQNSRIANLEYSIQPISFVFLKSLESIVGLLNPYKAKCDLNRIGNYSDGGYVVAAEATDTKKLCINLGVGDEVSADRHLLNLGYKVLAVDGTVENPLPLEGHYLFVQSNIGYSNRSGHKSLRKILKQNQWRENADLVLIDIEGFEYQLLQREWNLISRARQIVIEFHGLELLGDEGFSERLIRILKTMNKTHRVIHIHANNAGPAIPVGGASWPTILEVTFLRKYEVSENRNHGPYPTPIDASNTLIRPDIDLTPFFGEKPTYSLLARNILRAEF